MSDARWGDPREYDARDPIDQWPRVYDPRDRDERDPREALMRDLDLPRGDERATRCSGSRAPRVCATTGPTGVQRSRFSR
jgi:hypothetical protein